MAAASTLERLYSLRELHDANYGERTTLTKLIHAGVLPAVKVGNSFKIRERDLHLIAEPIGAPPTPEPKPVIDDPEDLASLAARIVSTWPRLTAERKAELGRILIVA